jgi:hypothetical protein
MGAMFDDLLEKVRVMKEQLEAQRDWRSPEPVLWCLGDPASHKPNPIYPRKSYVFCWS